MASFGTLLGLEIAKSIRRPMTWIVMVIFVGFLGFMYMVLTLASFITEVEGMDGAEMAGLEEQMLLPDGLAFGSSLVVGVGAVIMIVFAAGLFGSEFGWATIRTILLMRGPRTPLIFAKVALLLIMSVVVAVIGMGLVVAGSLAFEVVTEGSVDVGGHLSGAVLGDLLLITLRSTVAIAMWSLIAGMIALASSSMGIGLGVALAAYFIGDLGLMLIAQIGTFGEWVARVMPTWGINAMVAMNQVSPPDYSDLEIIGIVANLVIYAALFLALGIYRFRNMDVIAAS